MIKEDLKRLWKLKKYFPILLLLIPLLKYILKLWKLIIILMIVSTLLKQSMSKNKYYSLIKSMFNKKKIENLILIILFRLIFGYSLKFLIFILLCIKNYIELLTELKNKSLNVKLVKSVKFIFISLKLSFNEIFRR